jgi:RNA polymerase sigma-70 factor (ECF subfamily)
MGQIVRNVARNHGRRRARGPMLTGDERVLDGPPRSGPSAAAGGAPLTSRGALREDQAHFDDDVLAALRGLGEQARTCLLLRTVLDLPYHEISRLLDIPEGTAMSHVYRSRREMRRRLASSGSARQPDRA